MCSLYSVVELKYISLRPLQHKRGCFHAKFPNICPSLTKFQSFLAEFGQGTSVPKFPKIHSVGAGRTEGRTQMKTLVGFYVQGSVHREIYANNCPTRCNYIQFIYICKPLYVFRVVSPPIIRTSRHCVHSVWH